MKVSSVFDLLAFESRSIEGTDRDRHLLQTLRLALGRNDDYGSLGFRLISCGILR